MCILIRCVAVTAALATPSCCPKARVPVPVGTTGLNFGIETSSVPSGANEILIVSDSHASNPLTTHATWTGGIGADTWVSKTAIRPAQMDAWGGNILASILDHELQGGDRRPPKLVLHLGDATNIACRVELEEFFEVMKHHALQTPWVMAPGNHDSLAYGNWPSLTGMDNQASTWSGECADAIGGEPQAWNRGGEGRENGELLNKTSFLDAYVREKKWELKPTILDEDNNQCSELPHADGPVERVVYCRNRTEQHGRLVSPYASYILQQVATDDGSVVIVLDTTQFRKLPAANAFWKLVRATGGEQGGMHDEQIKRLEQWMEDAHKRQRRIVLAGHFPIDALDRKTRDSLLKLIARFDVATYISSHTHDPASLRDHGGFAELNTGSVLDWPMQYERLGVQVEPGFTRISLRVLSVPSEIGSSCKQLAVEWRADADSNAAKDDYTSYVTCNGLRCRLAHGDNVAYRSQRTAMYERLSKYAGTIVSERELEQFGRNVISTDPKIRAYEVCQVEWASMAEAKTRSGAFADPSFLSTTLTAGGWQLDASTRGATAVHAQVYPFGAQDEARDEQGATHTRHLELATDGRLLADGKPVATFVDGTLLDIDHSVLVGVRVDGQLYGDLVQHGSSAPTFREDDVLDDGAGTTWRLLPDAAIEITTATGTQHVPYVTSGYSAKAAREVLLVFVWSVHNQMTLDRTGK